MKKLLLALSLVVSPLVAMESKFKGEFKIIPSDYQRDAIEAYAKNWGEYQQAITDYCDVPEGTYDVLFQTMAEEMAGVALKEQKKVSDVMLKSLGKQLGVEEGEEAEGEETVEGALAKELVSGMREQLETLAALEHATKLTRENLEATAKIFSMARKLYLEREAGGSEDKAVVGLRERRSGATEGTD